MSNKKSTSKVNVKELKRVLNHIINTNKTIQAQGHVPTALNVIGGAGLGKTSTIQQVGQEIGFKKENIVKLSLSTFEEIGDLIGIPVVEYQMVKKDEQGKMSGMWVAEAAMASYTPLGYIVSNKSRMSYSTPEWIAGKTGPGLLILDDYTRASQRFTQAVMELVLCQEYASWSLPKGWTIVLSSNPDDGIYNVTDQDPAQKSRYMSVELGWNAEIWAEWADKNKIDSRCINFILMNPEIVGNENSAEVNARSISLFFNTISTISDFNTPENLELIQLLGEGSLGIEVTTQFTSFIHNKMDKLITSKELLNTDKSFNDIEKELKSLIKGKDKYRGDIAFVITTRLLNHIQFNMQDDDFTDKVKDRMAEILQTEVLGSDLKFILGRKLINMDNGKFTYLCFNDAVVNNILE